MGWIDLWRHHHPDTTEYTWHSKFKGGARANGLRLHHAFCYAESSAPRIVVPILSCGTGRGSDGSLAGYRGSGVRIATINRRSSASLLARVRSTTEAVCASPPAAEAAPSGGFGMYRWSRCLSCRLRDSRFRISSSMASRSTLKSARIVVTSIARSSFPPPHNPRSNTPRAAFDAPGDLNGKLIVAGSRSGGCSELTTRPRYLCAIVPYGCLFGFGHARALNRV